MRKYAILTFVLMSMNVLAATDESLTWTVEKNQDEFTDKQTTLAYVTAKGGVKNGAIMLMCDGGRFEGKVSTGEYVGKDYEPVVSNFKYRIDKDKPVSMALKTYSSYVFFNDINSPFVKALAEGDKTVLIEIRDYDFNADKEKFTLKGSTAAVREILSACNKLLLSAGEI